MAVNQDYSAVHTPQQLMVPTVMMLVSNVFHVSVPLNDIILQDINGNIAQKTTF